jgi:hypothetical protein
LNGLNEDCLGVYFEYIVYDISEEIIDTGSTSTRYQDGEFSADINLVSFWYSCEFRAVGFDEGGTHYYGEWETFTVDDLAVGYYLGFQYWEAANPGINGVVWYNPPYPEALMSPTLESQEFEATVEGLKPYTTYSFRAMAYDLSDYYFSATLNFTTLANLPIFGAAEGYAYNNAKTAAQTIAELGIGRVWVSGDGTLQYESRHRREA